MSLASQPSCHLLVVEDDPDVQATLQLILESEGYLVSTADNGREALALVNRPPRPCLILLDLMMPVMNGFEFIAAKEKLDGASSIPVVVVTAYAKQVGPLPVAEVLAKPIDIERLRQVVRQHCAGHSCRHR